MPVDKSLGGTQTDQSGTQVSAANADSAANQTENTAAETKQVDASKFEHALKDVHKFKSEVKRLQAENQALADQRRADEEAKLAEKNEFKTLAERYKVDLDKERKEKKDLVESIFQNHKISEVKAAALKAGIRAEAEQDLDLLTLEGVAVERTDHGRIIVHGADDYVQGLKKTKPHWFSSKGVANVNSGGGNTTLTSGPITPQQLFEIERKGDKAAYAAAYNQYVKQRAK